MNYIVIPVKTGIQKTCFVISHDSWIPACAGMTISLSVTPDGHWGNPENRFMRNYQRFQKTYWVYILASQKNGTLYIGLTNNLERRIYEHKNDLIKGFTQQYKIHNLVYYEYFYDINDAINREKQLKKWNRNWKLKLIEKDNPLWHDLSKDWFNPPGFPPARE